MRPSFGGVALSLMTLSLAAAAPARAGSVQAAGGWDNPAPPNRPTMEALHADIDACRAAGCSLAPRDIERMTWWVARGNRLAIRLSFAAAGLVDGDGARALAQSYGTIIRQDPAAFLAMARDEGAAAATVAADAAATADRPGESETHELMARRDALRAVNDPSLADLRDRCLAVISARLALIGPRLASAGA